MKKAILFMAFAALCSNAKATVITVSNNANSPGQYSNLQTAIGNAQHYDTLYISGSPIGYGNIYLTKPLSLIGAGALPNKNGPNYRTFIDYIDITFASDSVSGTGSKIIGCATNNIYLRQNPFGNGAINNVSISRCSADGIYFYASIANHNNIFISNNVVNYIAGYQIQARLNNVVIKNNIVNSLGNLGFSAAGSWIATNNKIDYISNCHSAVITNNIFYSISGNAPFGSCTQLSISNNLFFRTTATLNASDIIYGSNTGGNNLLNLNPMFINAHTVWNELINYSQDYPATGPFINYNLQTSSPGKFYGTDGTDIGIYGGATPFVEGYPADSRYRYFPMPAIPQMLEMNITNSAVLPAGTLNVNFKARKQN